MKRTQIFDFMSELSSLAWHSPVAFALNSVSCTGSRDRQSKGSLVWTNLSLLRETALRKLSCRAYKIPLERLIGYGCDCPVLGFKHPTTSEYVKKNVADRVDTRGLIWLEDVRYNAATAQR
jgi:hypothetical protein